MNRSASPADRPAAPPGVIAVARLRSGLGGVLAMIVAILRSGVLLRPWRIPEMLRFIFTLDRMFADLCDVLEAAAMAAAAREAEAPAGAETPKPRPPVRPQAARRPRHAFGRPARMALNAAPPVVRAVMQRVAPIAGPPTVPRVVGLTLAVPHGWPWRRGPPLPAAMRFGCLRQRAPKLFRLRN